MSIPVHIPQICALRQRVEAVSGLSLETHNAFITLSDRIGTALSEHISESTLERLWGYSTRGASSVSLRTLDVLCRYINVDSWAAFLRQLKDDSPVESEEFSADGIRADTLSPGARLRVGWLPDRLLTLLFLGDTRFQVVTSENSSLRPGDSFEGLHFQLGRPLDLERFRRAGSTQEARYVAGERSGLTTLESI